MVLGGPEGPEPALGFSEKSPDCPKNLESHVDMSMASNQAKQQKPELRPSCGGPTFFSVYVIIITSTLRFRLRYVTVAGATFLVYVVLP